MENYITVAGYLAIFMYHGKQDKDVQLLIDMINDLDPLCRLFIEVQSDICFTKKKPKQLLKALQNKLVCQFQI